MSKTLTAKSSIEASIEEAKRFGASAEDARKIHRTVSDNIPPKLVKEFQVRFGPDSVNNKAVWIDLIVDEDLKPSNEKIAKLNEIVRRIQSALLRANLDFWPYVDIRGRA